MSLPALKMSVEPRIEGVFDSANNTISYVAKDPALDACAIIDSVVGPDYLAVRITRLIRSNSTI